MIQITTVHGEVWVHERGSHAPRVAATVGMLPDVPPKDYIIETGHGGTAELVINGKNLRMQPDSMLFLPAKGQSGAVRKQGWGDVIMRYAGKIWSHIDQGHEPQKAVNAVAGVRG